MIKKIQKNYKTILLVIAIIILCLLKQLLIYNFPIVAYTGAGEDDALMIEMADSILEGNWLGDYSYHTLMKGPTFPILLALCKTIGISYTMFITGLYTFSCIVFMISIRKKIKNKGIFLLIFTILLFNPIMYAKEILQRVYRNALIPSFALLIIGSFLAMYIRRNEKTFWLLPWTLIASISLSLFYYTREDSIWIIPFLIFAIAIFIISLIVKYKKINLEIIIKTILIIIPIISLILFGKYISSKNEEYYGIYTTNILNNSNFADAMKAIYSVKPEQEIKYVSVTKEKIERIAEVSESFAYIEPILSQYVASYGSMDRNPTDGEVEDGWFFWALRVSVSVSGVKSVQDEEELYGKIADEINLAIEEGKLESQSVMPSALMPPWRKYNSLRMVNALYECMEYILTCDGLEISADTVSDYDSEYRYNLLQKFIDISGNKVIYEEDATDLGGNSISDLETQEEYINSVTTQSNIMNIFIKIYSVVNLIIGILGILCYLILTKMLISNIIKKKYEIVENWLVTSGILGAMFTLLVGVSYNHISSCNSITYLYLAGAYSLILAFSIFSIVSVFSAREKKKIKH